MKKSLYLFGTMALLFSLSCAVAASAPGASSPEEAIISEEASSEQAAPENETGAENETASVIELIMAEKFNVYVDGSLSFKPAIRENGEERPLSEKERFFVAEINGAVARADVYGDSVVLTGVQTGKTAFILALQRQNEAGEWEDVYTLPPKTTEDENNVSENAASEGIPKFSEENAVKASESASSAKDEEDADASAAPLRVEASANVYAADS